MATALSELTDAFDDGVAPLSTGQGIDGATVVVSWPSVPVEIVRAAGLRPLVVRGTRTATPAADRVLEDGIFPHRVRQLVDAALSGRLAHGARIVVPRSSDPDYKCFLYLRELARTGAIGACAPTLLFDLLHSRGPDVRAYDAARVRDLARALGAVSGRVPKDDEIGEQIVRANTARAAARRLAALRRGTPRVTGTEGLPLLGAFWQASPDRYAALAHQAADAIAARPPLDGPRILLAGTPVDGPSLHQAIEAHGAIVVAEMGPWGSGAAGADVTGGDPYAALADGYRADAVGARTPLDVLRGWTERALDGVDAVVVSLPPDDAVFGWDYPWLRERMMARGLPHVLLRGDPYEPLTPADDDRLDALAAAAARQREVRLG